MNKKNVVYSITSIVAIGAAAYLAVGYYSKRAAVDEGLDRPTYWVCKNEGCGEQFEISTGKALEHYRLHDGYVACLACESLLTKRADLCFNCGQYVESDDHGDPSTECLSCGFKMGDPIEHEHADGTTHIHGGGDDEHDHDD